VLQAIFREIGSLVEVLFPTTFAVNPQQNTQIVQIFCDNDDRWFQFTTGTGEMNWGDPNMYLAEKNPPECHNAPTLAS
jgi:hypothetical protein